jgi:hypothetical protein
MIYQALLRLFFSHRSVLPFAAFCLLSLTGTGRAQSSIWHVANLGGQPRDFTTVASAMASELVQDGDTIIISGNFSGENITLQRTLHLIGYGYFHTENGFTHPPTTQGPAFVGYVTVNASQTTRADGGSITGLTIKGLSLRDVDGFTVRRNNMTHVSFSEGTGAPARGILFIQNYLRSHPSGFYNNATITSRGSDNPDILIANNLVFSSDEGVVSLSAEDSMVFMNNIFVGSNVNLNGTGIFANNIVYAAVGGGHYAVENNLAVGGDYLPEGSGNINNEIEADVFVLDASPDGQYKLKTLSPALGAGLDSADMGVYGGYFPYVLSGFPPIPVITNISAPLVVNDGGTLSVQVSAEVHP